MAPLLEATLSMTLSLEWFRLVKIRNAWTDKGHLILCQGPTSRAEAASRGTT